MNEEIFNRIMNTSLSSTIITHCRLKHYSRIAETTEDNISRIGLGLSLSMGPINLDWKPSALGNIDAPITVDSGKNIRGKTLFKEDLLIFIALANKNQKIDTYEEYRGVLRAHWERGVQLITEKSNGSSEWITIIESISK